MFSNVQNSHLCKEETDGDAIKLSNLPLWQRSENPYFPILVPAVRNDLSCLLPVGITKNDSKQTQSYDSQICKIIKSKQIHKSIIQTKSSLQQPIIHCYTIHENQTDVENKMLCLKSIKIQVKIQHICIYIIQNE